MLIYRLRGELPANPAFCISCMKRTLRDEGETRRFCLEGDILLRKTRPRPPPMNPGGKVRKLKEPNDVDQSSGHASENEFDVRKARS